jgi:hypothetical protein
MGRDDHSRATTAKAEAVPVRNDGARALLGSALHGGVVGYTTPRQINGSPYPRRAPRSVHSATAVSSDWSERQLPALQVPRQCMFALL